MPIHTHPVLRSREKALESLSLIKTLDSVGYTRVMAAETAGTRKAPTVSTFGFFWWLKNKISPSV